MFEEPDTDDVAVIGQHEDALRSAMLANDVRVLDELVDNALVFTAPDGRVLSKEDDLSTHRDRLLRLDQLDLYERQVHRIGELIVVTVKARLAGRFGSTPFDGTFAYTRLWRKSGMHWRIVAGHASRIG